MEQGTISADGAEPVVSSGAGSPIVVIGAGIGGLAAAARLVGAGHRVLVLERASGPGGKMRQVPTDAGPADTGPTVLTMRTEFEALFEALGTRMEDHLTLVAQDILARHFWPDGSRLDLRHDPQANAEAIRAFSGPKSAAEFQTFDARAKRLFAGFEAPMMHAAEPRPRDLVGHVMRHPHLIRDMAPISKLAGRLARTFSDPRLRQLFGRYATYVGGTPQGAPALLELIWEAEAQGVWVVEGGMHGLAKTLTKLISERGGQVRFNAHVAEIETDAEGVSAVRLEDGTRIATTHVVFNGDPRALATGKLGASVQHVAPQTATAPRSLSAQVWAFAARVTGPDLAHHNVIFADDGPAEFQDIARGRCPRDPTVYLCAQDRGFGPMQAAPEVERFELILNAPPLQGLGAPAEDVSECQTRTFRTLARVGLRFDRLPSAEALTTPGGFERRFPATQGALYGQSPHGAMAAFQRPTARTPVPGLVLAGGGCHPGAGVAMAARSGKHAAAAILADRTSPLPSPAPATPGGTSTV